VLYPRKSINVAYAFVTLFPSPLKNCQSYCLTYHICRSVNYDSDKSKCYLFGMDANADHTEFRYWKDELSYYQRTCE